MNVKIIIIIIIILLLPTMLLLAVAKSYHQKIPQANSILSQVAAKPPSGLLAQQRGCTFLVIVWLGKREGGEEEEEEEEGEGGGGGGGDYDFLTDINLEMPY